MAIYDIGDNANELYTVLQGDEYPNIPPIDGDDPAFQIPDEGEDSPLKKPIPSISTCDLTNKDSVDGTGVFDSIMHAVRMQLDTEFKKQRIVGTDYANALVALTEAAMGNATQFLVSKDAAYWSAVTARYQALSARIGLITARADYMRVWYSAMTEKANFALLKVKALNEATETKSKMYAYDTDMPVQSAILELQKVAQELTNLGLTTQNETGEFNLDNILPQQYMLLQEQTEVQRAQTLDIRLDGATVVGAIGVQKDLHKQQITSYQRDSELKAARIFSDAWITQKTIDEGLTPPNSFANPSVDAVMQTIKTNNNL